MSRTDGLALARTLAEEYILCFHLLFSLYSLLFRRIHLLIQCALRIKIHLFNDVAFYSLKSIILSTGNDL